MPNIDATLLPTQPLRPTETGIESRVQSAYRGRALYNTAAEGIAQAGHEIGSGIASAGEAAVDFLQHREISAGAKNDADMLANLTDNWNQTTKNADPNDPSVAKKWQQETLEPTLEQFQKGFITQGGQKWAEARIDQLRNHFFEKTSADMSTLAGVAVQNNMHDIANKFSNTAIGDPTAVPFLLQSVDHSVDNIVATSPNLKGVAAEKVRLETSQKIKEEIVKSGMYGAIMNAADPEVAVKSWMAKYPDYISGPEAEVFAKQAKVQSRTLAAAEKQNLLYTKELANQNVATERNDIWAKNVSVDANGKVNINPDFYKRAASLPGKYQSAPNATETAKTLINWGLARQKEEETGKKVADDASVLSDLRGRLHNADNPTTLDQIREAEIDKLSTRTGSLLVDLVKSRDQIRDPVFDQIIKTADEQIAPKIGGLPPTVDEQNRAVAFRLSFTQEYLRQKQAGTLPPDALNMNNPNSLIRKTMDSYKSSASVGSATGANGGVGPAPVSKMPPLVKQNGHTYQLQGDGKYKAID